MGISTWSTTAASNNATPPDGAPEGMTPGSVNDVIREVMAQVRGWLIDAQWLPMGHTPTYVGATQFTVATDMTTTYYAVGRRVKAIGSTPFTIYGTISASSYSAPNTTVTVTWDSGSLNATLTAVYPNIIDGNGPIGSDLVALEALASTGHVVRTAANTYALRTMTGTSNRLTVTNGDGVAGAPTFDISASYVGQASITTLGTITTGTWTGTTIAVANGGTGSTSAANARTALGLAIGTDVQAYHANLTALAGLTFAKGSLIGGTGAGTVAVLAVGTNDHVLTADSTQATGMKWAAPASGSSAGGATETSGSSSITLTNSSNRVQAVAMTAAGKWVKLPDATTLASAGGPLFIVKNTGAYQFVVIDNGGQAIAILNPAESAMLYCSNIGTAKGKWYAGSAETIFGGTTATGAVGESSATYGYQHVVAYISDQKFLFGWVRSGGSFRVAVVSITDAGTLSVGSSAQVVSAASMTNNFAMCPLDASNVAVAYSYTSVNSVVVVGISGTTATVGTPTSVVATTSGNLHLFKISSTSVFYGYVTSSTSKGVIISSMSTAGNTVNSVTTCRAATTAIGTLSISQADVNTYIFATVGTSSYLDFQLVTVSGTTVTANTALANNSTSTAITSVNVIALSTTFFLCVYLLSDVLLMATVQVSTGTSLRLVDGGGNIATLREGVVMWNDGTPLYKGWVVLNNYVIFCFASPDPAGLQLLYFKYSAELSSVSFVRREAIGDGYLFNEYLGAVSVGKVSEGKYGLCYTNASSYPGVTIYHGITNP